MSDSFISCGLEHAWIWYVIVTGCPFRMAVDLRKLVLQIYAVEEQNLQLYLTGHYQFLEMCNCHVKCLGEILSGLIDLNSRFAFSIQVVKMLCYMKGLTELFIRFLLPECSLYLLWQTEAATSASMNNWILWFTDYLSYTCTIWHTSCRKHCSLIVLLVFCCFFFFFRGM